MAQVPANAGIPDVLPSTNVPAPYQRLDPAAAPQRQYSDAIPRGMQQLGTSLQQAANKWGEIAADDVSNQFQEQANKVLYGDPNVKDADGNPDTGYLGLKGRAALDQRADYEKKLDDLQKKSAAVLLTPNQQLQFSQYTRRYRQVIQGEMGRHADSQANAYTKAVTEAQAALSEKDIATRPDDQDSVNHATSDLVGAYVKDAQNKGAKPGDPLYEDAINKARVRAVTAQANSIAVQDPQRALKLVEDSKGVLGAHYDDLANRYRARAQQAYGRDVGDRVLSGSPPPAGDDAKAVVRHFEQFKDKAYWDVNHWRVGYGSDTVTKADGSVVPVTEGMTVSKEDAERDLDRRTAQSQADVRKYIGNDTWAGLSPKAQASLTSISYNYGSIEKLQGLIDAAKTKDPVQLAQAVRQLAGHNNGVNSSRRASEANNIAAAPPADPTNPGAVAGPAEVRSQADVMTEIRAMHLAPEAEAAAIARVTHSYAQRQDTMTRERAAFATRVKDQVSEAEHVGTPSNPIPESEFIKHYGPQQGPEAYAQYGANVSFGAQYKAVQEMSDVDQQRYLNDVRDRTPPGTAGYAQIMANNDRLRKAVDNLQKERRDDPAGAVSRKPAVQDALKLYDEKDPKTFGLVVAARLEAQKQMGIDEEYQSPITKAEALKLTTPLARAIPGKEGEALAQIGTQFRTLFGTEAPRALMYALKARHVDAKVNEAAASVLMKLSTGMPVTQQEAREFDASQADAAELAAIQSRGAPMSTAPAPIGPLTSGNRDVVQRITGVHPQDIGGLSPDPSTARGATGYDYPTPRGRPFPAPMVGQSGEPGPNSVEGSPVIQPRFIPAEAIQDLQNNPHLAEWFDKKFGSGRANEILKAFPLGPPGGAKK